MRITILLQHHIVYKYCWEDTLIDTKIRGRGNESLKTNRVLAQPQSISPEYHVDTKMKIISLQWNTWQTPLKPGDQGFISNTSGHHVPPQKDTASFLS